MKPIIRASMIDSTFGGNEIASIGVELTLICLDFIRVQLIIELILDTTISEFCLC